MSLCLAAKSLMNSKDGDKRTSDILCGSCRSFSHLLSGFSRTYRSVFQADNLASATMPAASSPKAWSLSQNRTVWPKFVKTSRVVVPASAFLLRSPCGTSAACSTCRNSKIGTRHLAVHRVICHEARASHGLMNQRRPWSKELVGERSES